MASQFWFWTEYNFLRHLRIYVRRKTKDLRIKINQYVLTTFEVFPYLHIGQNIVYICRFIFWIFNDFECSDHIRLCEWSCTNLIYAEHLANRRKYIENRRQIFWQPRTRHNETYKCKQTNWKMVKKIKMIFLKWKREQQWQNSLSQHKKCTSNLKYRW